MRNKNILVMVMFSVLLLSSCRLYKADEIKQHDGVMLVIGTSNQSMVDYSIDSYLGVKYNIYYDGTIERVLMYYLSGHHVVTTTLSDEDLITFYSFCMRYGDGEAFEDYSEEVYDGEHRYYIYYDEEGNYNKIYSGYCYDNETLVEQFELARSYFEDAEPAHMTGSTMVYQDLDSTPTPTCTPIPVPTLTPTPEPTSASTPASDYYHPNFYVNPDIIPTVETVTDGVYFGDLIGISEDGTRARFRIGEPIGLTQEFVDSLEIGDALGVFDINGTELTITGVSDTSYGRRLQIDDDSLFFSNAYSGFTDSVLICSDGVNPVTINNVYVELPISSYCEIIDFYRTLDNDSNDPVYDDWQANEPSGVPLLDSFFWYYENHNSWTSITLTDGWYNARSLAYPVVVNNGEVTGLYLEWR